MNKYKVVVYAISKNESKFVNRWVESMKEADSIYVLDTGSNDDTVKLLKESGVNVFEEEIKPWRFDVARNKSLELVPIDTDICVCTDLDEVFNKGWRKELEDSWDNSNKLRYTYNWSLKNNVPTVSFLYEKIHDRINYKWIYPVHEVLTTSLENEKIAINKNIVLNHYPDTSKSRSSYLPLLELSIKENPTSDRNMHYLGREYMFNGMWEKSIDTLIKHLNLPTSNWIEERCASLRFISRDYKNLNRKDEAYLYLEKALKENPNSKEAYVELAILNFEDKNYIDTITNCIKALSIKRNDLVYTNEAFTVDSTIDDLLSISYYYLGLKDLSIYHIKKALEFDPTNERLLKNKEILESN